MSNYTKRTLYGASYVFVFSLAAAFFAYLFRLLLAKNLSLSDFGLYYSLVAFTGFLVIFRDLGMLQSVYYFVPRLMAHGKKEGVKGIISFILKAETITSLVIFGLLVAGSGWLIRNYFHSGTSGIIVLFGIGFVINSLELNFHTFFLAFQRMAIYSIQNFARNMLLFVVTLFAFRYYSGINVPVVAYIVNYAAILVIFSLVFFRKVFPEYFRIKAKRPDIKRLIKFGIPATLAHLGFTLLTFSDTMILTYFRSLEEVGLYNAIVPIISLMLYVPLAVGTVIMPIAAEMWAKRKIESIRFAVEKLTKYMWIILIPMAAVMMIYPEITINLLFGDAFRSASTALMVLSAGAIFYGLAFINISFLQGIIGPRLNTIITLSSAAINIISNLALVPKLGILGAAIGTSIGYSMYFILSTYFLYKHIKLRQNYLKYALVMLFGGFFILTIAFLKSTIRMDVIPEAIIVTFASTLVYLILLFVSRILSLEEIWQIKKQLFA
jgi:O-antigen/teichoic acid export membrane protein